jgi:hypothetical protein
MIGDYDGDFSKSGELRCLEPDVPGQHDPFRGDNRRYRPESFQRSADTSLLGRAVGSRVPGVELEPSYRLVAHDETAIVTSCRFRVRIYRGYSGSEMLPIWNAHRRGSNLQLRHSL